MVRRAGILSPCLIDNLTGSRISGPYNFPWELRKHSLWLSGVHEKSDASSILFFHRQISLLCPLPPVADGFIRNDPSPDLLLIQAPVTMLRSPLEKPLTVSESLFSSFSLEVLSWPLFLGKLPPTPPSSTAVSTALQVALMSSALCLSHAGQRLCCSVPFVILQHCYHPFTAQNDLFCHFDGFLGRKERRYILYHHFPLKPFKALLATGFCTLNISNHAVLSFQWKNHSTLSNNREDIKWASSSKFVSSMYKSFMGLDFIQCQSTPYTYKELGSFAALTLIVCCKLVKWHILWVGSLTANGMVTSQKWGWGSGHLFCSKVEDDLWSC